MYTSDPHSEISNILIIYSKTCNEFQDDVDLNQIVSEIERGFKEKLNRNAPRAELQSWENSLRYMSSVVRTAKLAIDVTVAIEYQIPLTSKRIDFLLGGLTQDGKESVVVVELKQWQTAKPTLKDGVVETLLGGSNRETTHPSYQAWTYVSLIKDYNVEVQKNKIKLHSCAYLHNCADGSVINSPFYARHTERAPAFFRNDVRKLSQFIKRWIHKGDQSQVLKRIETSRLSPSKNLADRLSRMLKREPEFVMIDDQKLVYETVLSCANRAQKSNKKQVILVEGGPGTGKSVVAINLLVELTSKEPRKTAHYVTKNAAPKVVYQRKLEGTLNRGQFANLFKSSDLYRSLDANSIDCLLVDEAHRLTEKGGFYGNEGHNQIVEIIQASKTSVFFLDQDQRVHIRDFGDRDRIRQHALEAGAEFTQLKLESQFRCNGSDGYLSWVNNTLGVGSTANETLKGVNYDFQVFDNPNDLWSAIAEKNKVNNKSRVLAGYCWEWKGKKQPSVKDVVIPEFNFERKWNLDKEGGLFILSSSSIEEIGCVHTSQGLELDYVGVLLGRDFLVRDGKIETNVRARASQDRSVFGIKKKLKEDPIAAAELADTIIKNTYRVLMTRGQKGCYVFSVDPETNEYFKQVSITDN